MDVEAAGTEELSEETIASFEMLRQRMQEGYCSFYTSSFEGTAGEHKDLEREDLADSVNHVSTDPT